jgi:hypothetical protein
MAEATVRQVIGPVDIDLLTDAVESLESYLLDFGLLRKDLQDPQFPPPAEGSSFAVDIIPVGVAGLIEPGKNPARYRFLFDAFGQNLTRREDEDAIGAEACAVVKGLEALCAAAGIDPAMLVDFELLPRTIAWAEVKSAVATWGNANARRTERGAALGRLEALVAALSEGEPGRPRARRIAEASWLVRQIGLDAGVASQPRAAFQGLARYVEMRGLVEIGARPFTSVVPDAPTPPQLSAPTAGAGLSDMLSQWSRQMGAPTAKPTVIERAKGAWLHWRERLLGLLEGRAGDETPAYDDLVTAAAGVAPGALFRPSLARMSLVDWTALVLSALQTTPWLPASPYWAALGGLRVLGFDVWRLRGLSAVLPVGVIQDSQADEAFLNVSSPLPVKTGGGILFVTAGEDGAYDSARAANRPTLVIPQSRVAAYNQALIVLSESGLLEIWGGET